MQLHIQFSSFAFYIQFHMEYSSTPTGETKTEPLSEQMAKDYIGGIGLGIRLLFDNSKPGTDPFDPDNPIIYLTGPLSGTMGPTGGNSYAVVLCLVCVTLAPMYVGGDSIFTYDTFDRLFWTLSIYMILLLLIS